MDLRCRFRKAFDSVSHDALWQALREQGVSEPYVALLRRLYSQQTADCVRDD